MIQVTILKLGQSYENLDQAIFAKTKMADVRGKKIQNPNGIILQ